MAIIFLEIDDLQGGGFVNIACLTSWSETEDTEAIGTTTRDNNGWKTSLGLFQGKTIEGNGLVPTDQAEFSWEKLANLKRTRAPFNIRIETEIYAAILTELNLEGQGDQDLAFSFTMLVNGAPDSAPTEAPSGYSVLFETDPIDGANETTVDFAISGAEPGWDYDYTITSDGGGTPVTGSGTAGSPTFTLTEDLSGLNDGTITVSLTMTNIIGTGAPVTDTVGKNTSGGLTGELYGGEDAISPPGDETNALANISTATNEGWADDGTRGVDFAFNILTGADVDSGLYAGEVEDLVGSGFQGPFWRFKGLTVGLNYRISIWIRSLDSGVGAGDANIFITGGASAIDDEDNNPAWHVRIFNMIPSGAGQITLYLYPSFSTTLGNRIHANDLRVIQQDLPPSGYSIAWDNDPINAGLTSLTVTGGEAGWLYSAAITSTGGGSPIILNGVGTASPQTINVDVSSLPNGTLNINFTFTNGGGAGPTVSDTTTKAT